MVEPLLTACMAVRVRFAPSPTGLLHLGGARTALYNFLFAKANRGQCVLRLEDTDRERNVPGSAEKLQQSLQWLGIQFDESPELGGKFGPYVQSERLNIYQQYAKTLIQREAAYPCFCSKERLQSLRDRGLLSGYDGLCRKLSRRQANENLRMGLPHTVRLKVPTEGSTVVRDEVYGAVELPNSSLDDQVLLKADGHPTYHLASVVDDHCMEISHVLRGEEWLLSTAKHLLVYSGLDWKPPQFAHLPLLLSSTGTKLSKRNKDVFVDNYKERGFLPETVVNFIALLGWSPGSGQEVFTMEELVRLFSLEGVTKRAMIVEEEKLLWTNKQHFRQKLKRSAERQQLARQLQGILQSSSLNLGSDGSRQSLEYLETVLLLLEERVTLLPRVVKEAAYFWNDPQVHKDSLLSTIENPAETLAAVSSAMEHCDFSSKEAINSALKTLAITLNIPYRKLMLLCRLAVTGTTASPGLAAVMELLGRECVVHRLQLARQLIINVHK